MDSLQQLTISRVFCSSDDSECNTGYCIGFCDYAPNLEVCDPCDVNFPSDCRWGVCPAGECSAQDGFMPIGCACFEDDHCRGGRICVDGFCEAQGPGQLLGACETCGFDPDLCESSICIEGQCSDNEGFMPQDCNCASSFDCQSGLYCSDGSCQPLLDICFTECTDDEQCGSGWCAGSPGQCADLFDGVELGCSWYVT